MAEAKKVEKKVKKDEVLDDAKKVAKKKTTATKKATTKTTKTTSKTKDTSGNGIKKAASKSAKSTTKAATTKKTTKKTTTTKTKKEQTEDLKMKVEKVPSGIVVKKDDKEVVSKIKVPKVITEEPKKETKKRTSKKLNTEKENNIDNKELIEIKEQTIIDKIKSFLRKIVEMQKEAKEEIETIKEGAKVKKEAKAKKAKLEKDPEKDVKETYLLEYYDLPYRYNETVVRILAQTPKRLFVYWDISDTDREKYIETFGENFFNDTYPVLLLYNEDKKYIKEIIVNDFANSWYIDIENPKTKYSVQLGRKFRNKPQIINIAKMEEEKIDLQNDYLPLVNSNKIEAPNDRVLFERFSKMIKFRNVKTGQETVKDLGGFVEKISKAYDAPSFKEVFKEMNKGSEIMDDRLDMDNPTSGNPTSTFK